MRQTSKGCENLTLITHSFASSIPLSIRICAIRSMRNRSLEQSETINIHKRRRSCHQLRQEINMVYSTCRPMLRRYECVKLTSNTSDTSVSSGPLLISWCKSGSLRRLSIFKDRARLLVSVGLPLLTDTQATNGQLSFRPYVCNLIPGGVICSSYDGSTACADLQVIETLELLSLGLKQAMRRSLSMTSCAEIQFRNGPN